MNFSIPNFNIVARALGYRPIRSVLFANLPTASAVPGATYRVTDLGVGNGILLESNGADWVPQSTQVLARSNLAVSCGANTTENFLATITIPANIMGLNGSLLVTSLWSCAGSGGTRTLSLHFSGNSGTQYHGDSYGTGTLSVSHEATIRNRNSKSLQIGTSSQGNTSYSGSGRVATTSSVNTAVDTSVVLSGTKASAGDTLTLEAYMVRVMP